MLSVLMRDFNNLWNAKLKIEMSQSIFQHLIKIVKNYTNFCCENG